MVHCGELFKCLVANDRQAHRQWILSLSHYLPVQSLNSRHLIRKRINLARKPPAAPSAAPPTCFDIVSRIIPCAFNASPEATSVLICSF
jgi:hypothetical protein